MGKGSKTGSAPDATVTSSQPPDAHDSRPASEAYALPVIPRDTYEIIGEHARGGLGRVILARDRRLGRVVALKELTRENADALQRFHREAVVTARLQHPFIVPVHEAGYWDSGEPFYAMKFVAGRPLKDVIAEQKSLVERLALVTHVLAVAEAVAYAHNEGIIHRDLKPSNILVGDFGETVVVDWGLAKDLGAPGGDDAADWATPYRTAVTPELTTVGTVVGTPAYMPPEQAAGQPVDKRADVYALGAMLYHVLAGVSPYQGTTSDAIVASVLAGPPPALEERAAGAPRELLAITQKAMARDPRDRYPDGKAFADDLARYQSGQLVQAFRYGRGRLVARWLRRHRLAVAVAAAVVVAGGVVGAVSVRRITEERDRAEDARTRAEEAQRVAETRANELVFSQAQAVLPVDPTQTIAWLRKYDITAPGAFARAQVLAADAVSRGVTHHVLRPGSRVQEVYLSQNGRWLFVRTREGLMVHDVERNATVETMAKQRPLPYLAYSPKTDVAALSDGTGRVRLFDGATGTATEMPALDDDVMKMQFTPDGARLLALVSSDFRVVDCTVRPWHCRDTGLRLPVVNVGSSIEPSNDGHLFTVESPGAIGTFADLDRNRLVTMPSPHKGNSVFAVTAHGQVLTFGWVDDHTEIHIADAPGKPLRKLLTMQVVAGLFETDSLLFGDQFGRVAVVDPRGVVPHQWFFCGGDPITGLAATARTNVVAASDSQGRICVWNFDTGEARRFIGHRRRVTYLALSADGHTVVSTGEDGDVRFWSMPESARVVPFWDFPGVGAVHGSPWIDGAGRIVLGGEAGGIAILSTTDAEPRFLRGHTGPVRSVELSVDATEVLSAGWDGTVRLWTVADGKARTVLRHEGTTNAAGLLDGGAAVVSIGEDRRVQLWRRADDESEDLFAAQGAVVRLAIAHDGHAFAVSSRAGEVTAWTSSDATARSLPGHMATVMALAISPAGDLVASGGEDKVVRLSRVGDGGAVCRAEVGAAALSVAFAPDGRTVFAGLSDGRVLRLDAGCKATTVLRADGEVLTVLVRDHLLLVGSSGGDICLIETESGATVTLRGEARLISLAAGPKGTPIVSAHLVPGEGSSMRFWRPGLLPTPTTRRDFAAWLTGLTDFDGGTDLLPDSATGPASSSH